jgi:hypothetical protein
MYGEAWAADEAERRRLLEVAWHEDSVYSDPVGRAEGREALISPIWVPEIVDVSSYEAACRRRVTAASDSVPVAPPDPASPSEQTYVWPVNSLASARASAASRTAYSATFTQ